jgi:hypothetical protein
MPYLIQVKQDHVAAINAGLPSFGEEYPHVDLSKLDERDRATLAESITKGRIEVRDGSGVATLFFRPSVGPMGKKLSLPPVPEVTEDHVLKAIRAYLNTVRAIAAEEDAKAAEIIETLRSDPTSIAYPAYGSSAGIRIRLKSHSVLEVRPDVAEALKAAEQTVLDTVKAEKERLDAERRERAKAEQDEVQRQFMAEREEAAKREAERKATIEPLIRLVANANELERWEAGVLPQGERDTLLQKAFFLPAEEAGFREDEQFSREALAGERGIYPEEISFESDTVAAFSSAEWERRKQLAALFPNTDIEVRRVTATDDQAEEEIARRSYVIVRAEIAPGLSVSRRFAV